ncbi:UNVERIFIED_CONTAM: protein NUCLEAR FUSION defective [Sesamum radiatum]|uniref:Protein NUCLEAR FUSION defective n=1 Tax=Sesamum radiatum TaxID=300843 RepID=A0AAW2R2J9_SESRA
MEAESAKWVVLVAATWIQAFAATSMDFPAYSTALKSALGISQPQLNYISVASDMGKALGWCSGVCLLYFPASAVLVVAAVMGLVGYGPSGFSFTTSSLCLISCIILREEFSHSVEMFDKPNTKCSAAAKIVVG